MKTQKLFLCLMMAALMMIAFCSNPVNEELTPIEKNESLSINMSLSVAIEKGFQVSRVAVTIEKSGVIQSLDLLISGSKASGTFYNLEPGSYNITVNVYSGSKLIATGSGTGEVKAGATTTVQINLQFMVGNLEVIVRWGEDEIYNPKVTITFPANGSTVSEVVTVTCIATGSAAIQRVSLWVDGYPIAAAYDTLEPFELRWNTASYQDASVHTLVARALDANGNQMDSDPIQVTVDNSKARPMRLELRLIRYMNNTFQVRWPRSTDGDFHSYLLYQALSSDLSDEAVIYSSRMRADTSYVVNGITPGEYRYYWLVVEDTLGLKTSSTMQTAGAFEVLFSDEFDAPSSLLNWQIESGTWTVENGQLVCRGNQVSLDSYIRAGDTTWTDYEVSVMVHFKNGQAFILLRSIGSRRWEHDYDIDVWSEDYGAPGDPYRNSVGIWRSQSQECICLSSVINPPISNPADIRVRIEGSQISVFVNSRLVGQVNDPDPLTHGRFGLGVIWQLQSRFDNVVVWKL